MPKKLFRIVEQGAPIVNSARIVYKNKSVVLIEIDMKSKHCEVGAFFHNHQKDAPGISIDANECSMYLDETKDRNESTLVEFPRFAGYHEFTGSSARYTIRVCLCKT